MGIDMAKYLELEERFKARVAEDRAALLKKGESQYGVYIPNVEPTSRADYVLVAMEPHIREAKNTEEVERLVEGGLKGFQPGPVEEPLGLFMRAIKLYLCPKPEETTYWLTDFSKGAMPPALATKYWKETYEGWYPLLLEEIELVGKPGCPVIAIGGQVEGFLRKYDFEGKTGRRVSRVIHYSFAAAGAFKAYMKKDEEGFEKFLQEEVGDDRQWPTDFTPLRRWMAFHYWKRFRKIRGAGSA